MKTYIIITIALSGLASCGSSTQPAQQNENAAETNMLTLTPAQQQLAATGTGMLQERTLRAELKVSGIIDVPPQNSVSVSVPLGGFLRETHLLPGMKVKKGESIAILDDPQYIQLQEEYLVTRSRLTFAEAELQRQQELNRGKASSDKVLQQTQMEFTNQKIALKALGEKLKLININPEKLTENNLSKNSSVYSPIDGYVAAVHANTGKYVNPSDVIFELVNPADIHLNLHVYEKDLDKLFIGQQVTAFTNSSPEKTYNCEIILISRNISPDRTAEVHCHFEAYSEQLLPGMYMNAIVKGQTSPVMTIENDALVNFGGSNYLFIESGPSQYTMLKAETGNCDNSFTEIKNTAVFAGKKIVTKGAYTLLMSLKNKEEEE